MGRITNAFHALTAKGPSAAIVARPAADDTAALPQASGVDNGMLRTGRGNLQDPAAGAAGSPVAGSFVRSQVAERWITSVTRNLTPELIESYLDEAITGMLFEPFMMYEEMEEKCPIIRIALHKHRMKAASRNPRITPPKFIDDPKVAKAKADLGAYNFGQIDNWPASAYCLFDAVGKGLSGAEIDWKIGTWQKRPAVLINELLWVNHRHWSYWWDKPQLQLFPNLMNRAYHIDIPDRKFVVFHHLTKCGHPARAGTLRLLAWIWLIYSYATKDWATLSESFGVDTAHAFYSNKPGVPPQETINKILFHLSKIAARCGVFEEGTKIELSKAAGTGTAPQKELIAWCEEKVLQLILGSTLSTAAGEKGARSLGIVQQDETEEAVDWTALLFGSVMTSTALKWLMEFNFEEPGDNPVFELPGANRRDLTALSNIINILAGVGVRIPEAWAHAMFDIPEPRKRTDDPDEQDDPDTQLERVLTPSKGGSSDQTRTTEQGEQLTGRDPGDEITDSANFGSLTENQAQRALTAILAQAIREGRNTGAFAKIIQPVKNLLTASGDPAEMLALIGKARDEMKPEEVAGVAKEMILVAELISRYGVRHHAKGAA